MDSEQDTVTEFKFQEVKNIQHKKNNLKKMLKMTKETLKMKKIKFQN